MPIEMQLDTNPVQEDLDIVHNGLHEFNIAQAGDSGREKFAVFVRDESGTILGGVIATSAFKWLCDFPGNTIRRLSVPGNAR